jgi:predicted glycosyltransferase
VSRAPLLLHCQHTLGLGHLTRSFALAEALAGRFDVTLLAGGEIPHGVPPPADVEVVWLPRERRVRAVLDAYRALRPRVLALELFPFGRRKLADELLPLLDLARCEPDPPLAVCSVRDLLVAGRRDQQAHDEVAAALANQYLDAVLVHADPRFARLEETFAPRVPLRVPVRYTGFVVRPRVGERVPPEARFVVSAGGGRFGGPLFRAAVDAHALLGAPPMRIVAGPFLPEDEWAALRAAVRPGLEVVRTVPDLSAELEAASASVSQCGYNTALDLLRAEVPALVVPFAAEGEDEQLRRARRLEGLGAVRVLDPAELSGPALAAELAALPEFRPAQPVLDLDGARTTATLVAGLAAVELEAVS